MINTLMLLNNVASFFFFWVFPFSFWNLINTEAEERFTQVGSTENMWNQVEGCLMDQIFPPQCFNFSSVQGNLDASTVFKSWWPAFSFLSCHLGSSISLLVKLYLNFLPTLGRTKEEINNTQFTWYYYSLVSD